MLVRLPGIYEQLRGVANATHLVDLHQLVCRVLLRLIQWDEFYLGGRERLVTERRRESVEIMRAHGDKDAPAPDVVVKLVLQVDEGCVRPRGEVDVPENRASEEWADT